MKKSMDILNSGGKITAEQAEEIWNRYDEDGDGTLSKTELAHVLTDCLNSQKAALQHAAEQANTAAHSELTALFKDDGGSNDYSSQSASTLTPTIEHLVDVASTLAVGLVSQCVASIEYSLSPAGLSVLVENTYERLDVDGDGSVTKSEFVVLIGEILTPPGIKAACSAFDTCAGDSMNSSGNYSARSPSVANCNMM